MRDVDHAKRLDVALPDKVPKTLKLINANNTALAMFDVANIDALEAVLPGLFIADVDKAWELLCGNLVRQAPL